VAEKKRGRRRLVVVGVDTKINGRPRSLLRVYRERARETTMASNRLSGTWAARFRSIGFVECRSRGPMLRALDGAPDLEGWRAREQTIPSDNQLLFLSDGVFFAAFRSWTSLTSARVRVRTLRAHRDALLCMCAYVCFSFSLSLSLSPSLSLFAPLNAVVVFVLLNSVAVCPAREFSPERMDWIPSRAE